MIGTLCNDDIWIIIIIIIILVRRKGELQVGSNGNSTLLVLLRRSVSNTLSKKDKFSRWRNRQPWLWRRGIDTCKIEHYLCSLWPELSVTKKQKQKTMLLQYRWDSPNRLFRGGNFLPNMKQVWFTRFSSQIPTSILDSWGPSSNFIFLKELNDAQAKNNLRMLIFDQ